jgi:hypothetical protein
MKISKQTNENIALFVIAFLFWFVDYATTLWTLHHYSAFISEANPVAAWLFSFGIIGAIVDFTFVVALMSFMLFIFPILWVKLLKFLDKLHTRLVKKNKIKSKSYYKDYTRFIRILITGMIIGQEGVVLVHNYMTFRNALGI